MRYRVQAITDDGGQSQQYKAGTEAYADGIIDHIMRRQSGLGLRCTCKVYADGKLQRVVTMKRWQQGQQQ